MSDVLPPPPPPRGDGGCWKWGGITCLVGCGVLILMAVVIGIVAAPTCKHIMGVGYQAEACRQDMQRVWGAIEKYQRTNNKYPDKLTDLIPNFLPDERSLRFSQNPTGPEFTYIKPEKDAPGTAVILEYSMPFTVFGQTTTMNMRYHKDGSFESGNATRTRRRSAPSSFD